MMLPANPARSRKPAPRGYRCGCNIPALVLGAVVMMAGLQTAPAAELLYVPVPSANAVYTYDISLASGTAVQNSQQAFATSNLNGPTGIAFDAAGNAYLANQGTNTISKFSPQGIFLATIGSSATLSTPFGLAIDSRGTLYAANYGSGTPQNSVSTFDASGAFVSSITNQVNRPVGLAVDGSDRLYAGNWFQDTVSRFAPDGTFQATIGPTGISGPGGLVIDSSGRLLVANESANTVSLFDAGGGLLATIGASAGLVAPSGLAVDSAGNVYVSSGTGSTNSLISKFDSAGVLQFSWTTPDVSAFLAAQPVPEPSTVALTLAACGSLPAFRRWRGRKAAGGTA